MFKFKTGDRVQYVNPTTPNLTQNAVYVVVDDDDQNFAVWPSWSGWSDDKIKTTPSSFIPYSTEASREIERRQLLALGRAIKRDAEMDAELTKQEEEAREEAASAYYEDELFLPLVLLERDYRFYAGINVESLVAVPPNRITAGKAYRVREVLTDTLGIWNNIGSVSYIRKTDARPVNNEEAEEIAKVARVLASMSSEDVVPEAEGDERRYFKLEPTDFPEEPKNPKDLVGATKVPISWFPAIGTIAGAMGCADGGVKYGPYNWREIPITLSEYISAMERHLLDFKDGEDHAEDSKVHHLGHLIATAAIVLDAAQCGTLVDDRSPVKGKASETMETWRALKEAVRGVE